MSSAFNPQPFLDAAELIETTRDLELLLNKLADSDIIAVDIESAGFYKYFTRVNLIQIASRDISAILDPQKIEDFTPLKEFVKNSKVKWVFHGGDYDVSMLANDLGVFIPRIFDTRKAAEFIGLKGLGLSFLTEKYLGVILDKKLQRCDWSRRPLSEAMKSYALLDAVCLIPIHDLLKQELIDLGRLEWAEEEFENIARDARTNRLHEYDPYSFKIKGSSKFSLRSLAVLREVWHLRDRIAKKLDRAPFMLLSNQALLEIARQRPQSIAGLSVIKNLNREFLNRHGDELRQAIKDGMEAELVGLEKPPKLRINQNLLSAWEGELAKTLREIRDQIAIELGVAASLLAPSQALYDLARVRPKSFGELKQSEILHEWQADLLAEAFIPLLQQEAPITKSKRRRRRKKRWS